jgi:hypothetical protein
MTNITILGKQILIGGMDAVWKLRLIGKKNSLSR